MTSVSIPNFCISYNTTYFPVICKLYLVCLSLFFSFPFKNHRNIPIPGLSIIVPTIGHVGIDVVVVIFGNPDKLTLKIGLNACAELTSHELCASSIPGISNILPW